MIYFNQPASTSRIDSRTSTSFAAIGPGPKLAGVSRPSPARTSDSTGPICVFAQVSSAVRNTLMTWRITVCDYDCNCGCSQNSLYYEYLLRKTKTRPVGSASTFIVIVALIARKLDDHDLQASRRHSKINQSMLEQPQCPLGALLLRYFNSHTNPLLGSATDLRNLRVAS